MRVRVLSGVVGAALILLPAGAGRDSIQAEQRSAVAPASGAPIVQADLLPGPRGDSRLGVERDDPGEIEPAPATRPRPETSAKPATKRRTVVELTAPPAMTFDPIAQTDILLGTDPQIAVSEQFIVVTAAPTVVFFDRAGKQLPEKPNASGAGLHTRMTVTTLFGPVLEPFLRGPDGQPDPHRPNPNNINLKLGAQPGNASLICTPLHPVQAGCVNEAYDTRVAYDRERRRFWIVSALRDQVWNDGSEKCKTDACAPLKTRIPRRFVGVAVTVTDDPRDGFHEFVLVDEYADWPRFALHAPFLIVSHNSNTKVHLFDAQRLADGNRDHLPVSRGFFDKTDFNSPSSLHVIDRIVPVVQHDRRDESDRNQSPFIPTRPVDPEVSRKVPTFLVGIGGDEITIFAFDPNDALLSTIRHPALSLARVPLAEGSFTIKVNAVYRNGFIYVVGARCATGSGRPCNHEIHFLKIPVFRGSGPVALSVFASAVPSTGFVETVFGGLDLDSLNSQTGPSFEIPGVEVNRNDDAVVVYERSGFGRNLLFDAPGAFYRLVAHGGAESDGILHLALCGPTEAEKLGCAPPQPELSHIDTAGIAVDPTDDRTVWMAHAIADSDLAKSKHRYRLAIGHVTP